jgi:hypothetical protein
MFLLHWSLEEWANIGQVVSAVATLVTILFAYQQIRFNQKQLDYTQKQLEEAQKASIPEVALHTWLEEDHVVVEVVNKKQVPVFIKHYELRIYQEDGFLKIGQYFLTQFGIVRKSSSVITLGESFQVSIPVSLFKKICNGDKSLIPPLSEFVIGKSKIGLYFEVPGVKSHPIIYFDMEGYRKNLYNVYFSIDGIKELLFRVGTKDERKVFVKG